MLTSDDASGKATSRHRNQSFLKSFDCFVNVCLDPQRKSPEESPPPVLTMNCCECGRQVSSNLGGDLNFHDNAFVGYCSQKFRCNANDKEHEKTYIIGMMGRKHMCNHQGFRQSTVIHGSKDCCLLCNQKLDSGWKIWGCDLCKKYFHVGCVEQCVLQALRKDDQPDAKFYDWCCINHTLAVETALQAAKGPPKSAEGLFQTRLRSFVANVPRPITSGRVTRILVCVSSASKDSAQRSA